MYDVYYTTGGGPWLNAGTDTWVNIWLEEIAPKLKVKPVLLIHRNKPKNFHNHNYTFPIQTHWHGDDIRKFEKIVKDCRRIHILHGHYTPQRAIEDNKHKIYSNVLHNSVDHIVKSTMFSDVPVLSHPFHSSKWEIEVNEWAKKSIWIGLFPLKYPTIDITNFYEFKQNKPLSSSTNIGFAARCESRKNPHLLDRKKGFAFTDGKELNDLWKKGQGLDFTKLKVYHYNPKYKDTFYNMDWGISHSCFTYEPFGYSIFEAVDYGKLPILHPTWCKNFEYPYRAASQNEFTDIYNRLITESFDIKNKWFNILKQYMIKNFTDKQKWINQLLDIYNI